MSVIVLCQILIKTKKNMPGFKNLDFFLCIIYNIHTNKRCIAFSNNIGIFKNLCQIIRLKYLFVSEHRRGVLLVLLAKLCY